MTDPGPVGIAGAEATEPHRGGSGSAWRDGAPWQLLLVALPVVLLGFQAWRHRWITEDAFIDFRVVQQMGAGHGIVFNVGQRVEVATSPAWLAILAILRLTTADRVDLSWLALVAGLSFTLAGVTAGALGSMTIWRRAGYTGVLVPLGILVIAVMPPMWDFSTSGLETGLEFAWLGAAFLVLARLPTSRPAGTGLRPVHLLSAGFMGIGLLIRPDFVFYSVSTLVVLGIALRPRLRGWLFLGMAWAALPIASELFRMAYFAVLVPNTAIAKHAAQPDWAQGFHYFTDFAGSTYWLGPVFFVAGALLISAVRRAPTPFDWRRTLTWSALPLGAVLQAIYVVRVGGDFMHARVLLAPTFALAIAVGMFPFAGVARSRIWPALAGVALVVWCALAVSTFRTSYGAFNGTYHGIENERLFWIGETKASHPITAKDYSQTLQALIGSYAAAAALRHEDVIFYNAKTIPGAPGSGVTLIADNIGIASSYAGLAVRVVDPIGLADPIAARTPPVAGGRIGHDKSLPLAWYVARYGAQSAITDSAPTDVQDARDAIACSQLANLLKAVSRPLTPGQALHNMVASRRLTRLSIPSSPEAAKQVFCR